MGSNGQRASSKGANGISREALEREKAAEGIRTLDLLHGN
jgi:hypothetical protein